MVGTRGGRCGVARKPGQARALVLVHSRAAAAWGRERARLRARGGTQELGQAGRASGPAALLGRGEAGEWSGPQAEGEEWAAGTLRCWAWQSQAGPAGRERKGEKEGDSAQEDRKEFSIYEQGKLKEIQIYIYGIGLEGIR